MSQYLMREIRSKIFDSYKKLEKINKEDDLLKYFEVDNKKTLIGKLKSISFRVEHMGECCEKYQSGDLYDTYDNYLSSLESEVLEYKK